MDLLEFITVNLSATDTPPKRCELSNYFTLTAPPNSALWRTPHSYSVATAPMLLTCLRHPFILAEVTVSADFDFEWDQAGLAIFAGAPPSPSLASVLPPRHRRRHSRCEIDARSESKWVKAGLEFTGGILNASSVVATSESGVDWSLCPLFSPIPQQNDPFSPTFSSLRIKFERIGDALWIWYRIPSASPLYQSHGSPQAAIAEWRKLREVTGFFSGVESKAGVWVGCYASRPIQFVPSSSWEDARPETSGFCAEFEELEIL